MSKTGWLTDNIINATQKLLQKQYPAMPGLQETLLGKTLTFDVMEDEFVQVLHSGGCHWVAVSTVGCPPSTVVMYDSLYSSLPLQMKEQILLLTKEPRIDLNFANVQSHKNGCDCGVFTLAL